MTDLSLGSPPLRGTYPYPPYPFFDFLQKSKNRKTAKMTPLFVPNTPLDFHFFSIFAKIEKGVGGYAPS